MSDSWRISVNDIDQSQTINSSPGNTGAMVIRSSKGPLKPIYVNAAKEKTIVDIYGEPSVTYPDVWEAIQYNKTAPMWISAPYASDALLGGVIVSAAGTVAFNDSEGTIPASIADFTFADSTEYFILTSISPYADDLGVKISYDDVSLLFTILLYRTADSGTTWVLIDSYKVSMTSGTLDGFGQNVYVEEIFDQDPLTSNYLQAQVNATGAFTSFVDDVATVALSGGSRGTTTTITEWKVAWNYFQNKRIYEADIFMDPTADGDIPAEFDTLRSTYQTYSEYLLPLPQEAAATAVSTKAGYSIDERGLAFYWNRARVKDTYNNSSFWTTLIGRIGGKHAQMKDVYNGLAPSWIDENGHGGQLGSGILELKYDPSESELETFDDNGINPIVFDFAYGVMIVSQKTGKSPTVLSDSSWIAHSRMFDFIVSTVKEQVLVYQITKLNDDAHRQLAYSKTDQIMSPISALNLVSEYGIQCDRGNNDDVALAARKFVLTLAVKVTPFSETIVFNFVQVGQTQEVSNYISS